MTSVYFVFALVQTLAAYLILPLEYVDRPWKKCPELLQERPRKRELHTNVPILRLSVSLPNI